MLNPKCKFIKKNSRGAAMVEAAIVFTLFMGLVGVFMHYTLRLHYYSGLSYAVTSVVRQVTVTTNQALYPNPSYDADVLTQVGSPAYIGQQIEDFVRNNALLPSSVTLSMPNGSVSICRDESAPSYTCRLRVKATIDMPCILCLFPNSNSIEVQVDSGFEDPCFITSSISDPDRGCYDPGVPVC